MSVFTSNIYVKDVTEVIGIGVTVDSYGVVTAVTGPTWRRRTVSPNGVVTANAGSLASQTDGTLWINTDSATTWVSLGGGGTGWNLPNDVVGTWGTTSPLQFQSVYVSASNRFDLRGVAVSQATAQASAAARFATGAVTITGAVAGSASGAIEILSGVTDTTNAGGQAGNSGTIMMSTGAATSTTGALGGSSGGILINTGNSTDLNSGSIVLQTGTAAGTRGQFVVNVATINYSNQAIAELLIDKTANAWIIGAAGAPSMMAFSTFDGAEQIDVGAVSGMRFADSVPVTFGSGVVGSGSIFTMKYNLGLTTFAIAGDDASGTAAASRPITFSTGAANANAGAGGASGAITIRSGNTDSQVAATSSGVTGQIQIVTGNSASTFGSSSSNSGQIALTTGSSDDANTGVVAISTGNALAAGGGVASGNVTIATGTVAGTGTTGNVAITTGNAVGAGISGNITLTPGTTAAGTRGTVTALGLRTTSSTAAAITGVTVLVAADSGGVFSVSQAAGYQITLPTPPGPGLRFQFYLTGAAANNVTIVATAATFVGTITIDAATIPSTGSTLTYASGSAVLGDNIEAISISTSLYLIRAIASGAGGITIT
jgi:hypothetical protein